MLDGIITAMITPFDDKDEIDYSATELLIEHLIQGGVNGLFILGTNGEFHVINNTEKINFAKKVCEQVNGRVPILAGAGGNSTKDVINLGNEFSKVGINALSVINPFFVNITDDELSNHYKTISKSVDLPIVLYNIPKNTGKNISADVVEELSQISNIIGIKDSSGDINNIKGYIERTKEHDFKVLSGSDSLILDSLILGSSGAISATSNVLTENNVNIYRYFKDDNLEEARYWQNSLEEFRRILKFGSIPSVLKYSIEYSGIAVGNPRLPILPIDDPDKIKDIKSVLEDYKKYNKGEYNG